MKIHFFVKDRSSILPGETVYITGNVSELGKWDMSNLIPLYHDVNDNTFHAAINFAPFTTLEYKYLIFNNKDLIRWEENVHTALYVQNADADITDKFHTFCSHRWVYNRTLIRLFWSKLRIQTQTIDPLEVNPKLVNTSDNHRVTITKETMEIYTIKLKETCLEIEFHHNGTLVAKSFITDHDFVTTKGEIHLKIIAKDLKCIGDIMIPYFVIPPFVHSNNNISKTVNLSHWKKRPFFIGHRGMGISNTVGKRAIIAENTVLSLTTAMEKGADFVEFDVNLTKCKTPLVYHDFTIGLSLGDQNLLSFSVQDLDYDNIKNRKFRPQTHIKRFGNEKPVPSGVQTLIDEPIRRRSLDIGGETSMELLPISEFIPTLKEVFEKVKDCGFDVEVKYPLQEEIESFGLTKLFDQNTVVDEILKVCFNFNHNIFFSTFEPEVACLLAAKQTKYPVLFLTEGGMGTYSDPRCNSIENAIEFCLINCVHGIVTDCRPILTNPSLIQKVLDANLLLMAYGVELSDDQNVKFLVSKGVHGIICDGIGHVIKNYQK